MDDRPVLYLDLDDTIVSWEGGRPHAAPGAREFVLWALEEFEVRWLTTWCPGGEMEEKLLGDLARMLELHPDVLRHIRGCEWREGGSKVNGIAWLEHLVRGRRFVWLEDDKGVQERERRFLEDAGLLGSYRYCNVTEDRDALLRIHDELRETLENREAA